MLLVSTVIRSRVDVNDQRLAGQFLGCDSGEICEPVVCVDDIKFILMLHCNGTSDLSIAGNLFHKVGAVLAGELELLSEADTRFQRTFLFHLFDGAEILVRIHIRHEVGVNVHKLHLIDELINGGAYVAHLHITRIDDGCG